GPARLKAALAKVPKDAREWRPAPREWSAHEVVCHCADSETNGYARIRYLLAETDPVIQGYDQEEWARRFDYHGQPLDPALANGGDSDAPLVHRREPPGLSHARAARAPTRRSARRRSAGTRRGRSG